MTYDEFCFERYAKDRERDYLSHEFDDEVKKCCGYDCDNEATECVDGEWYCEECFKEISKLNN